MDAGALQAATLPLASKIAPGRSGRGITITPIGFKAAVTARSAFTIPLPHWPPPVGQAHSPVVESCAGHTGVPAG